MTLIKETLLLKCGISRAKLVQLKKPILVAGSQRHWMPDKMENCT